MLPIEIGCGKIWKTPRGPKGDKRAADVIGNAVKVTASRRARKRIAPASGALHAFRPRGPSISS
jgi:hypothetical protein